MNLCVLNQFILHNSQVNGDTSSKNPFEFGIMIGYRIITHLQNKIYFYLNSFRHTTFLNHVT